MEKKKKKNWFLTFLGIMFIIYIVLYLMDNLGYYNIYIWEYGALATFSYKNMLEYNSN